MNRTQLFSTDKPTRPRKDLQVGGQILRRDFVKDFFVYAYEAQNRYVPVIKSFVDAIDDKDFIYLFDDETGKARTDEAGALGGAITDPLEYFEKYGPLEGIYLNVNQEDSVLGFDLQPAVVTQAVKQVNDLSGNGLNGNGWNVGATSTEANAPILQDNPRRIVGASLRVGAGSSSTDFGKIPDANGNYFGGVPWAGTSLRATQHGIVHSKVKPDNEIDNLSYTFFGEGDSHLFMIAKDLSDLEVAAAKEFMVSEGVALDFSTATSLSGGNSFSGYFGNRSLIEFYGDGMDVSNVTDFSYCFNRAFNATLIDISDWYTSSAVNMSGMFQSCTAVESLDAAIANFDTSNVTDMSAMFSGCSSVVTLNTSHFDTTNVTGYGFKDMFYYCSSLEELDVSHFNTTGVVAFNRFVKDCPSLKSLNIAGWDTSSVQPYAGAYYGFYYFAYNCPSLTDVTITGNGNTAFADSPCTNYGRAFTNTNLSQESIDNILVAIEQAGTSNGSFDQSGGSAPSSVGEAAIDALTARGWTITVTGGYTSPP